MSATSELRELLEKTADDARAVLRRALYGSAIGLPVGLATGLLTPVSQYEPTPLERRLVNTVYGAGGGVAAGGLAGAIGPDLLANLLKR